MLYILVPAVTFKAIFETKLSFASFTYPIFFFCVSACLALIFFKLGKLIFKDREHAALLSLCAGLANVGYFGVPVIFMLYGEKVLGIAILLMLGLAIHESSVGFMIAASGKHELKEAINKTLKLPSLYVSLAAILINLLYNNYYLGSGLEATFDPVIFSVLEILNKFIGAFTVLGMLIIGLGLASIRKFKINLKFISLAFIAKFICYPLIAIIFIYLDKNFLHIYDEIVLKILFLLSIVPTGANTITIATELDYSADEVSITVMLSTIFALIYIPLMVIWSEAVLF